MPNAPPTSVSSLKESDDSDSAAVETRSMDALLVRRVRDGDTDAFGGLVRTYQRRAVSVAYRLLGNMEDAADVTQDAFVRAYRSLGQLDDPSRFGPWLMRVVSNLSLNYRRSRKGRAAVSLEDMESATAAARDPRDGQPLTAELEDEHGPWSQELQDAISAGMEQLPDQQRLALILFSVEGMPQKEVAEILECSVELVKWNVFQARKKLKEQLRTFL